MAAGTVQPFLGADISMTHAGLVVVDQDAEVVFEEAIGLGKAKGKAHPPILKVRQLHLKLKSRMRHIAAQVDVPVWCAIEQPAFKARHMAYHLGMTSGLFSGELYADHISHFYVNPVMLKRFVTGNAMATKDDMVDALIDGHGFLESDSKHHDLADALGLARMARCWRLVYGDVPAAWRRGVNPGTAVNKALSAALPAHARECFESKRVSGGRKMGLIYRPDLFADFASGVFFGVTAWH